MKFLDTADILLPKKSVDYSKFSVVACDQYTSQPDYWERVKSFITSEPSSYNMVFPEIYLENSGFELKIDSINKYMNDYYQQGVFENFSNSMIFTERTLKNGRVRKGLVGIIDLEHYDYRHGSKNFIRATEGTVLDRIPPRVRIRQNAMLELPHVMLLIDDDKKELIEPLSQKKMNFQPAYNFELMENSGNIRGYILDEDTINGIDEKLNAYSKKEFFNNKYHTTDCPPMLFAVGDGNHSLATAKECYERIKVRIGDEAKNHLSRYALVELVNLHDDSLEFEAIHRVLFDIDPEFLLRKLDSKCQIVKGTRPNSQVFSVVYQGETTEYSILNPNKNLVVGTLQDFFDEFLYEYDGKIDYIHGADVVIDLSRASDRNIGFILPAMDKSDLFKTVILDGALPRKTFSMGEACDKRFYLESRIINTD